MRCQLCANRGVIRIGYTEVPGEGYFDFGICSCKYGQRFRTADGRAGLAAKFGVSSDQVNLVEELLDPHELPGFVEPPRLDVTDAGRRTGKAKL